MDTAAAPVSKTQKEALWRELLAQHRSSGQTAKVFCQEQNLTPSTFSYWRHRLGESTPAKGATVARFVDAGAIKAVGPQTWADSQRTSAEPPASLDIHLELGGGLVLHIRRH